VNRCWLAGRNPDCARQAGILRFWFHGAVRWCGSIVATRLLLPPEKRIVECRQSCGTRRLERNGGAPPRAR
jgi:hypothetical protein